jgi:hypothetical protein
MRNGPFDGTTAASRTFIKNAAASGSLTPPTGGVGPNPLFAAAMIVGFSVVLIGGIILSFLYGMVAK